MIKIEPRLAALWAMRVNGREERIRTSGPCLPKTVLYQAELLPDGVRRGALRGPAGDWRGAYSQPFRAMQAGPERSSRKFSEPREKTAVARIPPAGTVMMASMENGAPRAIRTPDPQIRSLMLYPAELWVHRRAEAARQSRREAGNPGAPRAIRTPDPQIRSLMLYPAELWVHWRGADSRHFSRRKGAWR